MGTRAAVVGIEVASKQKYLFETDKLREMVGASRLMAELPKQAQALIDDLKGPEDVFLFQPLSGDVRLWADLAARPRLLSTAWALKEWLDCKGIEHTVAYFECDSRHFLDGTAARHITVGERRDDDQPQDVPSLSWVNARLSRRHSTRQETTRSDARPTNSFFAPCQIYGADVANCWEPAPDPQEPRRQLVSQRAKAKLAERNKELKKFYQTHLEQPIRNRLKELGVTATRPITFSDLAEALDSPQQRDDSFIAFVCADADDMGRLLPLVNWNAGGTPWKNNRDFITDLDSCVQKAFHDAIATVAVPSDLSDPERKEWQLETDVKKKVTLPALPQLLGGDDLWTVARKEVALELASVFAERFGILTNSSEKYSEKTGATVRRVVAAVPASDAAPRPQLTMSVGVAFAKFGHPAYAMAEAAEELLKSAKERRKGQTFRGPLSPPEGCIDWHKIESSLVESISAARSSGWRYHDPSISSPAKPGTMLLTTRPWTVSETRAMVGATRLWKDIGRRKREQVEDILRRGHVLSELAWTVWLQRLQKNEGKDERAILENVAAGVEKAFEKCALKFSDAQTSPWIEISKAEWTDGSWFETPFLDLLALSDVLPSAKSMAGGDNEGDGDAGTGD